MSQQPEHTPGPWGWDSRNGNHYLISCAPNPPQVIVLGWPAGLQITDDSYGRADAALIAAAPDLLAALKEICAADDIKSLAGIVTALSSAKAAIAKAEGVEHVTAA